MSRQELADAVNGYLWATYHERGGLDRSYVGKLEQGVHRWPRARLREAFRHVLGAANDGDLGFFIIRNDASIISTVASAEAAGQEGDVDRRQLLAGLTVPGVTALITAVTTPFTTLEQPQTKPAATGLDAIARQLSRVRSAYQHSRYAAAMWALPGLLSALRNERKAVVDQRRAAVLDAEAYQVASALLLKAEEPVLAAIAADRSVAAAQAAGDDLAVASSARAVVHCLMSSGHPEQGTALATQAADHLASGARMGRPALSLYGALLLRGAIAAARREDRDRAHMLLNEAARAADHLGSDGNLHWTAFGPTNVAAHRVAIAVELGDAGTAVASAKAVDLARLQLPERKAMLMLDTARALMQWGKWERAFDAIRSAERHAPEEVRARPAVHMMINQLAERSPSPLQRRVRAYARLIGVAA
jgi:hypothetical protein